MIYLTLMKNNFKKIIFTPIVTLIVLFTFKDIEELSLESLSWTFSKLLPYILLFLCGICFVIDIARFNFKRKATKILVQLLLFITPFGIGFGLHPIYEGDFSKEGQETIVNSSPSDFQHNGLTVVTIPDCPFCFEAIEKLKKIKKRNPSIIIDYVVCVKNKDYVKNYIQEIDGAFSVRTSAHPDSLAKVANFRFPAFIYVKNLKPTYLWSNDQFGVRAIDELESKFD